MRENGLPQSVSENVQKKTDKAVADAIGVGINLREGNLHRFKSN